MKPATTTVKLALVLSWTTAAILALLPFHALFTTWAGSNFNHLDLLRIWKEILITLMIPPTVWLIWRSPKLKQWFATSWIARLFTLYVLLHATTGAWALAHHEVNGVALIYALLINLRFIGFFLICLVVATSSDFLGRNWRVVLLAPAGVVLLFGLLQKFILPYDFLRHFGYGSKTIPAYQTVDANLDFRRLQSTLRGANPLGSYLVLIIPAIITALRKNRIVKVVGLSAAFIVLFYSYSRSAWIGASVAIGALAWLSLSNLYRLRWLVVIIAVGLLIIGGSIYLLRSNQTAQDTLFHTSNVSASPESSNAQRAQAIKNGASDVWHQPQGRGPGTAGPASVRNDHPARIAENYYLQIGQEVGIAGLVMFIVINALVAWQLWRVRTGPLSRILLASLAGITFINLVSHAWTDDTLSLLWWGLAGIALAPAILKAQHKQNGQTHQATT